MIYRELDLIEAVDAAERLCCRPGLAFLDSAMKRPGVGRYSYLGVDPFGTFEVRQGRVYWCGTEINERPLSTLRGLLQRYHCEPMAGLPPFQGGCIGFFAYDFANHLEGGASPFQNPCASHDVFLSFYDVILAFDHALGRCWLVSSGWPEADPRQRKVRARARLETVADWLAAQPSRLADVPPTSAAIRWQSNFSQETYLAAVEQVRDYIRAGDIYQANISQRFTASLPADFQPWRFYRRLREENPAPFAAYLTCGDLSVASSSPERFLRLHDGQIETRPIKGTIERSPVAVRDRALAEHLLASEKDRAENIMIVDLLRNDLSRVCAPGSVEVPSLCALESYASVHHLVSVVTGRLRAGVDGIDLLRACFPGGSITGAPKIRAMEIINELEDGPREIYCGAIGYLGFDGNMDLNIAIRTIALRPGKATFQAGGGITLLSDPATEYEETLAKARKLFGAFEHPTGPVLAGGDAACC